MKNLKYHQGSLILFFLIFATIVKSQSLFSNMAIGINLPPLIGNTLDVRLDTKPKESLVFQIGMGLMVNNTLKGSITKVDDFTDNHKNSGAFVGVGLRHLYLKRKWSNLYFGYRLIGGYYEQYADFVDIKRITSSPGFAREIKEISRKGPFLAAGIELLGAEFIIKKRVIIDLGFQLSKVLFSSGEVSEFSVFPGTGALGIQGTLSPKIILGKRK